MPEQGKVKWFDARDGKRFGFILLENGEEIFFHFNDGRFLDICELEPFFTVQSGKLIQGKIRRLRDPQLDDILVFMRSDGQNGKPKAAPWSFQSMWQRKEEEAARLKAAMENAPTYRALEVMNSIGKEPGEPTILWEGKSLPEALKKFPLPQGRQSPSADPMLPYWSDSDNIFEVHRWWEKQSPDDGTWERCNDPRPLPGVLRQFETISRR